MIVDVLDPNEVRNNLVQEAKRIYSYTRNAKKDDKFIYEDTNQAIRRLPGVLRTLPRICFSIVEPEIKIYQTIVPSIFWLDPQSGPSITVNHIGPLLFSQRDDSGRWRRSKFISFESPLESESFERLFTVALANMI